MRRALRCLIAALAIPLACCAPPSTAGQAAANEVRSPVLDPGAPPALLPSPCWGAVPPGVTARCGYVTVPENRRNPSGNRAVRLALMILGADNATCTQAPTVLLGGGPGQHTIALVVDLLGRYQRLLDRGFPAPGRFMPLDDMKQFAAVMERLVAELRERQLILLDQRGTGYSEPSLACDGREWRSCRRRLAAAGIDLGAYNTVENAHDVNDVRVALGLDRVNLRAGSYGTRLALEVLRRYPATVRAAVLDGVSPPQILWGEEMARRYDEALGVLFTHCREDRRCQEAYPGLDRVFYETVRRLNQRPAPVAVGEHHPTLDGDDFRDMAWNALFDVQKARWLPAMIWRAARGDTTIWGEMIAANAAEHAGGLMSWGMHYSIECSGSWAFQSPRRLAEAASRLDPAIRGGVVRTLETPFGICADWRVPPVPEVKAPVQSDVPVLLLSGEFDPGTPPAFAEIAARTLPRSYRYVLPYLGHTDGFTSACHASIVLAFLDDPAHAPDTSCLAGMDRAAFEIR
ncbi:MAG: alpha/beta fold hydrolase [Acidobacteria bacterium]|nr:alpha/beta fold hydrolase [Acidobacteriota bacterium]